MPEVQALEGLTLQHPVYDKQVPVVLGDHVSTEAGTGAVHTAPDHGMDDFVVGQRYGIDTLNLVQADGTYTSAAGEFAGIHVYKADDPVCQALERHGKLVRRETVPAQLSPLLADQDAADLPGHAAVVHQYG